MLLSSHMFFILMSCLLAANQVCEAACESYADNEAVNKFREYIRIDTSQPVGNLTGAKEFWTTQAASLGLPMTVYELYEGKPIIVIKWAGANASLPSIMLNSHMDVVYSDPSEWTHAPYSADIDDDGNIYGRGTQDMKCVSIQYLEAIRTLKANDETLSRTVYMTLMPDEEIGGHAGMKPFLETDAFAAMNVGFALDEGVAYPSPAYLLFYADKSPWQIQITCMGVEGHASSLPASSTTAVGKCRKVMNSFLDYRDAQYEIAARSSATQAGNYTSINLTILKGGEATNIIPDNVTLTFDMRLATNTNETEFQAMIDQWISDAGDNVTYTYILKDSVSPATAVDDSNIYWTAFKSAADSLGLNIVPIVSPGTTDERFVRAKRIPGFGFSPMANTTTLLHSPNEYINAEIFLNGINIYIELLRSLGNLN